MTTFIDLRLAAHMNCSSIISESPTFKTHSSNDLANIADRVVQELRTQNGFDDDDIFAFGDDDDDQACVHEDEATTNTRRGKVEENKEDNPDEDEEEFEFAVVCRDANSSLISADDIFSDGQILPRYPLFDRSLLLDVDPDSSNVVDSSEIDSKPSPVGRLSLRKLFSEERDSASCSSSEADDLDGIAPGTYCVWRPKTESHGNHKKSNSIDNTSKRWKVRDLLKRSYSDDTYSTGKDKSVVLFTPLIATKQKKNNVKVKKFENTAKVASAGDDGAASTKKDDNNHANKAKAGGNRRRPYLPYGQDQVGIFANFNGSSKNLYRF